MEAAATRLGVDEVPLRMSIDDAAPYPTVDVIAAIVRVYGVDPTWLLTGEYDPATHRKSLTTTTAELPAALNALIDRTTPYPGVQSNANLDGPSLLS